METEDLDLKEEVTHKEFHVVVNYYDGSEPYINIQDINQPIFSDADKVYKIKVPYKLKK